MIGWESTPDFNPGNVGEISVSPPKEWLPLIWEKGREIPGADPDVLRQDDYGEPMQRDQHGNRKSLLGWEVDHIVPESEGGKTELSNLRPLNWQSNLERNNP